MNVRSTWLAFASTTVVGVLTVGCFPEYSFATSGDAGGTGGSGDTGGTGGSGGSGNTGGTGGSGGTSSTPEGMALIEPPNTAWAVSIYEGTPASPIQGSVRFSRAFWVDKYEVTTGRFRVWHEEQLRKLPCEVGTCSLDPGGPYESEMIWQAGWNGMLAETSHLSGCYVPFNPDPKGRTTWQIAHDEDRWDLPMTCVSWYEALAFCASEGKRLLTESEWIFTATDGKPGQPYPWGDIWQPACSFSIHKDSAETACGFPTKVGTASDGATETGVFDLTGSVFEWVWDRPWDQAPQASLDFTGGQDNGMGTRVRHGGAFIVDPSGGDARLQNNVFEAYPETDFYGDAGFRCAKSVPLP